MFSLAKRHDNKISNVLILLVKNLVVVAQAPIVTAIFGALRHGARHCTLEIWNRRPIPVAESDGRDHFASGHCCRKVQQRIVAASGSQQDTEEYLNQRVT